MFYQQWVTVLVILLASLPFGLFPLVLASLVTSMVLRGCVGGTHARHPVVCKVTTFVLAFVPAVLAGVFAVRFVLAIIAVIYLLSLALVLKYAPGETHVTKFRDPRVRKRLKIESIVWVSVFCLAAALLNGRLPAIAFTVAVTTFSTTFLTHPLSYRLFGFDPVTKEAVKSRR